MLLKIPTDMYRLMVALGIVVALAFLYSGPSLALECEYPLSEFEKNVCEDAENSVAFAQMETVYSKLLTSVSQEVRNLVVSDQEAWQEFADLACINPKDNPRPNYESEQRYCIGEIIVSRENWLENPWYLGGLQLVPSGVYATKIDTVNTMGPLVGKYVFSATLLDETNKLSAAFNEYARNGYGQGVFQALSELSSMSGEVDSETYVQIYQITPERVSSMIESSLYYHGAAHGTSYITYEHYLVGEKRGLVAGDIFAGENWRQKLQDVLTKAILSDEALSEDVWDDFDAALPTAFEPDRWKFTPEGLEIQFQQYELAAYAYGLPVVVLSWKSLRDILSPQALRIAGVN